MSPLVSGECLCDEIFFVFEESSVLDAYHCSCRDCQKITGYARPSFVVVPNENFHLLEGSLSMYNLSSNHREDFVVGCCETCEQNIVGYYVSNKSSKLIPMEILNDTSGIQVTAERWTNHPCNWSRATAKW